MDAMKARDRTITTKGSLWEGIRKVQTVSAGPSTCTERMVHGGREGAGCELASPAKLILACPLLVPCRVERRWTYTLRPPSPSGVYSLSIVWLDPPARGEALSAAPAAARRLRTVAEDTSARAQQGGAISSGRDERT